MAVRDNPSNNLITHKIYICKYQHLFKNSIQPIWNRRAEYDELFARSYRNPLKNIEDCITYILNYVQKSGCNGFDDDEIFGQAVHYYDEADIEVGKPIDCKVVVNHHVELTEEEKAEARKEAIKRAENEVYSRMTQRKTAPKKENKNSNNGQMALLF